MRIRLVPALLVISTSAYAERAVITIGATFDAKSKANETNSGPHVNGGLRAQLTFEDAPLAIPPAGLLDTRTRLVPELLAGFVSNDVRAEGFIGAGLRAELQMARRRYSGDTSRFGFYVAGRAKLAGKYQDGGGELAFGSYALLPTDARVGWEVGVGVIKKSHAPEIESPQLECLATIYAGF